MEGLFIKTLGVSLVLVASTQYSSQSDSSVTFPWPSGKRAAVSLSFDDSRPSQLDVGIPILDRYGVKATFYVNPRAVELRAPDWRRVAENGHEVGNHSTNHPCSGNFSWSRDYALEDYSLKDIGDDIDLAISRITDLVGRSPQTFAYPCGQKFVGRGRDLKSYVPVVAERFLAGRGWLDESSNDPEICDLSNLMAVELDGLSMDEAKKLIEEVVERGGWLILAGHDIGAEKPQTVLSETLEAICRYAGSSSSPVWLDTIESVASYIHQKRFRQVDDGAE